MGLQERAAKLASFLTTTQRREGETIVIKTDDAPEWVGDVVHAVHGDMLPDDWTYETIKDAADAIAEDGEDAELEADIYTHSLLTWLRDYPGAVGYVDDAAEQFGEVAGIIEQIQRGQYVAQAEIVAAVISQLELLEDDEDDDDESEGEHRHEWGPVELSRFGGNPHRRCACGAISLDLDDEDDETEGEE